MKPRFSLFSALLLLTLLLCGCGSGDKEPDVPSASQTGLSSSQSEDALPSEDTASFSAVLPEPEASAGHSVSAVPPEAPTGSSTSTAAPEASPEVTPEPTVTPADGTVYCTGSSVNIRTAPSTAGEIAGVACYGDPLECTGIAENGWFQVLYQGQTCYVSGQYFSTEEPPVEESTSHQTEAPVTSPGTGIYYAGSGPLVAIDAGHQLKGDSSKEPNGPGSSTLKAKVTSGATGVSSGVPEYKLTLAVSLKLRDALLAKGYSVLMIRETNDVSISNAERAQLANSYDADIFLRIHANSSDNSSATGTLTMAPSTENPYCSGIAKDSQALSDYLVNAICAQTGFQNRGVTITDTMTGINWCQMPVSIIEMGFLSNGAEDEAMQTDKVQGQIVQGIVEGVDQYFGR